MARIVATLKILPTGTDIPMKALEESVKRSLPEGVTLYKSEEEPIAFGLVALIVHLVMPEDISGGLESIESRLNAIPDVGQIDTVLVRRV
jgi:elongation factor 1-beta